MVLNKVSLPFVKLCVVGDVMLARNIGQRIINEGPEIPFAAVSKILEQADLRVINLECIISNKGTPEPKAYTFQAPLSALKTLTGSRVDIVNIANNHALDYGTHALEDMISMLKQHKMAVVGAGLNLEQARYPAIVHHNDLRIAFLAYLDVPIEDGGFDSRSWIARSHKPGMAWATCENIFHDVTAIRSNVDLVVVMLHFGEEYLTTPTVQQRTLAKTAIDSGAILVLGTHPHVLQPIEHNRDGLIVYSLGNFIFDDKNFLADHSAIFHVVLDKIGIREYYWTPIIIEHGLPKIAKRAEALTISSMVQTISS